LEDFSALLLRHYNPKWRAVTVTQAAHLLACITQNLENTGESTLIDEHEPFLECVFGLNRVIGIGESGFDPLEDSFELRRILKHGFRWARAGASILTLGMKRR
jgi:hypothetical protein